VEYHPYLSQDKLLVQGGRIFSTVYNFLVEGIN
jgi:hypothetical protein